MHGQQNVKSKNSVKICATCLFECIVSKKIGLIILLPFFTCKACGRIRCTVIIVAMKMI